MRKLYFSGLAGALLALASATAAHAQLIPFGSTWSYLDDGSDQGTAWRDGMAALRIAETLSPDHDSNDPRVLEALFMSLAETATFPEARRLALRAAKLLREAGENEWAADVERYAEAFARGESVRSGQ